MNEFLQKFRAQYPQYNDMSDADLVKALHGKFYADMPLEDFTQRIGRVPPPATPAGPATGIIEQAQQRLATGGGNAVSDFLHMMAEGATLGQAEKFVGLRRDPEERQRAQAEFQQRTADLRLLAPGASTLATAAAFAPAVPALAGGLATAGAAGPSLGLQGPMATVLRGGQPVRSAVQAAAASRGVRAIPTLVGQQLRKNLATGAGISAGGVAGGLAAWKLLKKFF